MVGYSQSDVRMHNADSIGGPYYPAVNVKVSGFALGLDIEIRFHCSETIANQAMENAWQLATEAFWQDRAETLVERYFGKGTSWGGAGRSGGWLLVEGIDIPENWDAIALNRWACFEKAILDLISELCSAESVAQSIEINGWANHG